MDRGLKIDAGYEAVPSPQWVKDRSGVGECCLLETHPDITRRRHITAPPDDQNSVRARFDAGVCKLDRHQHAHRSPEVSEKGRNLRDYCYRPHHSKRFRAQSSRRFTMCSLITFGFNIA